MGLVWPLLIYVALSDVIFNVISSDELSLTTLSKLVSLPLILYCLSRALLLFFSHHLIITSHYRIYLFNEYLHLNSTGLSCPVECNFLEGKTLYSFPDCKLFLQCIEQCLEYSMCSINMCYIRLVQK